MKKPSQTSLNTNAYTWQTLKGFIFLHKRSLIFANIIAIIATLLIVPIPLLMPVLVDEVLLNQPASLIAAVNTFMPRDWQTPTAYIIFFTILTLLLRVSGLSLLVLQTRAFTLIAKDITYKIRKDLLSRVNSISMSEYETLGSGTISSHFVVDVETIDKFISETVSKFIVAVLLIIGIISVLFWLHWKLALIIIFLNPLVVLVTLKMGKYIKELRKTKIARLVPFNNPSQKT